MSEIITRKNEIISALSEGEVIFMPTDTIPGLVCSADNSDAVEQIFAIKHRDDSKPPTIIISKLSQLEDLGIEAPPKHIINKYWPGPTSIILEVPEKRRSRTFFLHRGRNSLAVRMTNSTELQSIINVTGPLATSSANLEGQNPAINTEEAKKYFGDGIQIYVETDDNDAKPSTIIRINSDGDEDIIRP